MGKETRLFDSQQPGNRAEVGAFLRQIADKLDSAEVVLRRGIEALTITSNT